MYVVYGAGAVGGVIGARLRQAGMPVTLVARGAHLAAIQEHGLTVESPAGTEVVDVPVAPSARDVTWTGGSVVILTIKSHQTAAALEDLARSAPPDTQVVSAQNGVANEAAALRRFGNVFGLCVMQPCAHMEPGVVVQQCHPVPGILDLGRYPSAADPTAERIAHDLRTAGFESRARPDIMAWKYRKLIMNLGTAIQGCYQPGPDADELRRIVQVEGERVLAAGGITVVSDAEDQARRDGILHGHARPDYFGSVWQSLARGHGVETDWINGEIVLLGRLHGVPTPANLLIQKAAHSLARSDEGPRSLDAAAAIAELERGSSGERGVRQSRGA